MPATKEGEEEDGGLPSDYDTFYFYYYTLKKLCDFKSANNFLAAQCKENEYIFGYLYTVQMMVIKVMNELADFSRDWNIYTLLHYGNKDLSDPLIQKLRDENAIMKYVYTLKTFRTTISDYLYSDNNPDLKSVEKDMEKLNTLITDINSYIIKEFEVKSINEGKDEARAMLLTYITNTCYRPESDLQPIIPGHPQPEGTYKATFLGNQKLSRRAGLIFNGYKHTFAYLLLDFSNIIGSKSVELIDYIKNAKTAYEIRHGGSAILDQLKQRHVKTFSMGQIVNISKERDIKAEKYDDLDFVFMNRDIKVVRASKFLGWSGHFDLDEAAFFFIDTLRGIVVNPEAEVELLEITYKDDEDDDGLDNTISYTYALYLLMGNSYANASFWIVFDRIALASTKDSYKTDSKYHIDNLIKAYRGQLILSKISVKRDLLMEYYLSKDLDMEHLNTYNEGIKRANGMLVEFLAYLYTKVRYDARLIGLRVPYKETSTDGLTRIETDIDALSENNEFEFVCQAKSNIPVLKRELEGQLSEILKHFDGLKNRITTKKVKNIVFVGNWSYAGDTYFDESYKAEQQGIELEELRKHNAFTTLSNKGIQLVFYEDLRFLLLRNTTNILLVQQLDKIFEHHF